MGYVNDVSVGNHFLSRFVEKYGPKNVINTIYPVLKRGDYRGLGFEIKETVNAFFVTIEGHKRKFTSAWMAAAWIQKIRDDMHYD